MAPKPSSPLAYSPPERVLRTVGIHRLIQRADDARCDCLMAHLRRPFHRALKSAPCNSRSKLATQLDTSTSKAKRIFYDDFGRMKVGEVDDYLRKIGASPKEAYPSDESIEFAIMTRTLAMTQGVRGDLDEPVLGTAFSEDDLRCICELAHKLPSLADDTASDPQRWQEHFCTSDAEYPGPERISDRHAALLTACDWQRICRHLPWETRLSKRVSPQEDLADILESLPRVDRQLVTHYAKTQGRGPWPEELTDHVSLAVDDMPIIVRWITGKIQAEMKRRGHDMSNLSAVATALTITISLKDTGNTTDAQ